MSETSKSRHNASLLPPNPPCRIHIQLHPVLNVKVEMSPSCERCWGGQQQQGLRAEETVWELCPSSLSPASRDKYPSTRAAALGLAVVSASSGDNHLKC